MLKNFKWTSILLVVLLMTIPTLASAGALFENSSREKELNFEDQVVEGMNKKPYDYLSTLGGKKKNGQKARLYRKRIHFRKEISQTIEELPLLK